MPVAMIVEDDESIRMLYREALQRSGFTVVLAANVNQAIKLLGEHTPDIAFIDMNMPEHLGTEVLAHIRATPRLANVKTVMVTANTYADSLAEEYNVDLFLVKPVPLQEMIQLAQRLTGMDYKH
jgi:CheY-like chemotaxis protein